MNIKLLLITTASLATSSILGSNPALSMTQDINIIQPSNQVTSPRLIENRERRRAAAIEMSRISGDPSSPLAQNIPDINNQELIISVYSETQIKDKSTFVSTNSDRILSEYGCGISMKSPFGVENVEGQLNGIRSIFLCDRFVIVLEESDYSTNLRNSVFIDMPTEALNIDFGQGRAWSRYLYDENSGTLKTVFSWINNTKSVSFEAFGGNISSSKEDNDLLRKMMQDVVSNVKQ